MPAQGSFLPWARRTVWYNSTRVTLLSFIIIDVFVLRSFWLTFYIIQIILSCQINWLSSQLSDKNHGQVIYCLIDMKSMYITVFQKISILTYLNDTYNLYYSLLFHSKNNFGISTCTRLSTCPHKINATTFKHLKKN